MLNICGRLSTQWFIKSHLKTAEEQVIIKWEVDRNKIHLKTTDEKVLIKIMVDGWNTDQHTALVCKKFAILMSILGTWPRLRTYLSLLYKENINQAFDACFLLAERFFVLYDVYNFFCSWGKHYARKTFVLWPCSGK